MSENAFYSFKNIWSGLLVSNRNSKLYIYQKISKNHPVWINFCIKIIKENIWWTYLDFREDRVIKEIGKKISFYRLCNDYELPEAINLWYANNPICKRGKLCDFIYRDAHKYRFCHNCDENDKLLNL